LKKLLSVTLPFFIGILSVHSQTVKVDSMVEHGRTIEYFGENVSLSTKGVGGNIFLGAAYLNGPLSKSFSHPFLLGLNVEILRKSWLFQVNDHIGFSRVQQDRVFEQGKVWEEGKLAFSFFLGGNVGYSLIDNKNIRLVPLAGAGFELWTSTPIGSSEIKEFEPVLPKYKLGFFIDFKRLILIEQRIILNGQDAYYSSLRLSMGMSNNIGTPKFDEYFRGATIYLSLGMGGISRDFE
jgi:hypothetical protein